MGCCLIGKENRKIFARIEAPIKFLCRDCLLTVHKLILRACLF